MTPLAQGLLFWALLSLGTALLGLWRAQSPFWRSFFFMNGAWGLVDGALGLYALGREAPGNLREILLLNAGLDVLYLWQEPSSSSGAGSPTGVSAWPFWCRERFS